MERALPGHRVRPPAQQGGSREAAQGGPSALPPVTIFGPDFPFAFDDWIEHPAGLGSIPAANHGAEVAIEKTYRFDSFLKTMAFVNAIAFIAEQQDHHPEMLVGF